jgi:hypothetical protein
MTRRKPLPPEPLPTPDEIDAALGAALRRQDWKEFERVLRRAGRRLHVPAVFVLVLSMERTFGEFFRQFPERVAEFDVATEDVQLGPMPSLKQAIANLRAAAERCRPRVH